MELTPQDYYRKVEGATIDVHHLLLTSSYEVSCTGDHEVFIDESNILAKNHI